MICEGCREPIDDRGLERLGSLYRRTYCMGCAPSVKEFLRACSALRADVHADWGASISELVERWKDDHPQGKLPGYRGMEVDSG